MKQLFKRTKRNHLINKTSQFTPKYQLQQNELAANQQNFEELSCNQSGLIIDGFLVFSKASYLNVDSI
jgi:hypothetical protein